MFVCKHCSKQLNLTTASAKANHTRWCHANPKRSLYSGSGSQLNTPEAIEKRKAKISEAHAAGKYEGAAVRSAATRKKNGTHLHTDKTKELLREKALKSKHRRLVRSVREYVCKDGTVVMLDSSWEEALAKRLDSTGVNWIRPKDPIEYLSSDGKTHNYFPDFYLPDHNLYLDPKNPAAIIAQKEKLNSLRNILTNLIIIDTLDGCNNFSV